MTKQRKPTAAETAKAAGLKSLAQVAEMTGIRTQTLNNWFNHRRRLFLIVIRGCAAEIGS